MFRRRKVAIRELRSTKSIQATTAKRLLQLIVSNANI